LLRTALESLDGEAREVGRTAEETQAAPVDGRVEDVADTGIRRVG